MNKKFLFFVNKMLVFPLLKTKRLSLRKLTPDDFDALVSQANNKKISDQIINVPHPYEWHHAVFRMSYIVKGFEHKSRFVFAITLNTTKQFIGEISLHLRENNSAELGYWLGEDHWKKGFALESTEAIIKFGFETLHLDMIFATCSKDNTASIKVLLKNEFSCTDITNSIHTYIKCKV